MPSNGDNENENEDDDETMSQNKKVKDSNGILDETLDKPKSFEEQINSLKKLEDVKGHRPCDKFGDKEVKSKYFQIELGDMPNEIRKMLFKQIFGHKLETSINELINTINKEENQIIVNDNNKNEQKLYEKCQTSYGRHCVI